jgi:hypothetical protein
VLPHRLRAIIESMPRPLSMLTLAAAFGVAVGLVFAIVSTVLAHQPKGLSTSFGDGVAAVWLSTLAFAAVATLFLWRDPRSWLLIVALILGSIVVGTVRDEAFSVTSLVIAVVLLLPSSRAYFRVARRGRSPH